MEKTRTFVAVKVQGLSCLEKWMSHLRNVTHEDKVKWNPEGAWHLTLKFIGDVNNEDLERLRNSLRKALAEFPPGDIVFQGSGFFGDRDNPKVIWVGVQKSNWLNALKEKVEKAALVLQLPSDERPFRPHLTLGRVKYLKDTSILIDIVEEESDTFWGKQEVKEVILYKSRLTSDGPVYSVIESFKFEL